MNHEYYCKYLNKWNSKFEWYPYVLSYSALMFLGRGNYLLLFTNHYAIVLLACWVTNTFVRVSKFLKLLNISLFISRHIFLPDQVIKINHIAFENNLHTFGFNFKLTNLCLQSSICKCLSSCSEDVTSTKLSYSYNKLDERGFPCNICSMRHSELAQALHNQKGIMLHCLSWFSLKAMLPFPS